MALNSLMALQINPKIETAKKITQFLNYIATHSDAITEHIKSGMILHIYSNASYISEPEAKQIRGDFFPRTKIQHIYSRDTPGECTSACRMQHHEKCYGISHGSRTERAI